MIITIANQKGGTAKTTTAHNIGQWLILNNKKVLFIDLDSQANLSCLMGANIENVTAYELFKQKTIIENSIQHTPNGDIISASPLLALCDREINKSGSDIILKQALKSIYNLYDYIIIDTPPALGLQTINAFSASDYLIITAQADIFSLQGIGQLSQTINTIKQTNNPNLKIAGILITRFNSRSILNRDLTELITETAVSLNTKVYSTRIREGVAIKESQASQTNIFSYAPKSGVAIDYINFIKELITDINS